MPFSLSCPDHRDIVIDPNEVGIADHVREYHPGQRLDRVADRIERTFSSQTEAQGNTPLRVMGCRSCGAVVETRDPDRGPYCDDHAHG